MPQRQLSNDFEDDGFQQNFAILQSQMLMDRLLLNQYCEDPNYPEQNAMMARGLGSLMRQHRIPANRNGHRLVHDVLRGQHPMIDELHAKMTGLARKNDATTESWATINRASAAAAGLGLQDGTDFAIAYYTSGLIFEHVSRIKHMGQKLWHSMGQTRPGYTGDIWNEQGALDMVNTTVSGHIITELVHAYTSQLATNLTLRTPK